MKKHLSFLTILSLLTSISACSSNSIDKKSTPSILDFTKEYYSEKSIKISANEEKTINNLLQSFESFYNNKLTIKQELNKLHIKITSINKDYADPQIINGKVVESNKMTNFDYSAKTTDGSDLELQYLWHDFGQQKYSFAIWNLTPEACSFIVNKFKTHEKITAKVAHYISTPQLISKQDTVCEQLNSQQLEPYKYTNRDIAVILEYNGKLKYNTQFKYVTYKPILLILNKQYEELKNTKLLFTTQNPYLNNFLKGADYVINEETNTVTIGALNQDDCLKFEYKKPSDIKISINNGTTCIVGFNQIEFSKIN